MQAVADVDEADIGAVKEGNRVTFTVDAYPDDTFEGTVKQVRLQATTTNNVVTYEVVISAQNADLKLKPVTLVTASMVPVAVTLFCRVCRLTFSCLKCYLEECGGRSDRGCQFQHS